MNYSSRKDKQSSRRRFWNKWLPWVYFLIVVVGGVSMIFSIIYQITFLMIISSAFLLGFWFYTENKKYSRE